MKACKQCGKFRDESMLCPCCGSCIECSRDHFEDTKRKRIGAQPPAAVAQG